MGLIIGRRDIYFQLIFLGKKYDVRGREKKGKKERGKKGEGRKREIKPIRVRIVTKSDT